ncbi:MAG: Gfo/Idh/MocA family oxidoreductase [Clostridia bacterium]|nr:Gfo/Idh/MocA family oxidoreductase [Clostridia bacterium]
MAKKKVAIVGFGGQGNWHGQKILKNNVVDLVGIYDIRPVRMEYAKEQGIHTYESYEDMLAGEADIIVVATPNDSHKDLCVRALRAGKHVICEKPVTMSVEEFDEIVQTANETGKVFEVHQNRRWDTDFLLMKDMIETERIGKPLFLGSYVQGSRGIPGDWRCEKQHGGGMMLDWGVHLIDQMLLLVDSPINSLYCITTNYTNSEVDDGFKLFLHFANGVVGYVEVGTYNFITNNRFYGQFEQGTAQIMGWNDSIRVRQCTNWGEGDAHPVQTASGITKTMAPRSDATVNEFTIAPSPSDVHDFYRNFVDAIEGKAQKRIADSEVRRVLLVMQSALTSAAENRVVTFSPAL